MFERFLTRIFPRYGRKARQVTIITFLKGLLPWTLMFMATIVLFAISYLLTRNPLIPLIILITPMGLELGAFNSWRAGIQTAVATLSSLRRLILIILLLPGNRYMVVDTYLEDEPHPHHVVMEREKKKNGDGEVKKENASRWVELDWNDNLRFVGLQKPKSKNGHPKTLKIPAETWNYDLQLRAYIQIPEYGIDADKVTLMSKDEITKLPLHAGGWATQFKSWFGLGSPILVIATPELADQPEGLDQTLIIRDARTITSQQTEEHLERVSIANKENVQLIAAIIGPDRERANRAEYELSNVSRHRDAIAHIVRLLQKHQWTAAMALIQSLKDIDKIPRLGGISIKKLIAYSILIAVFGYVILWLLGVIK